MIDSLRTANFYSGSDKYDNPKEISVTEISGGEPLQMYLRRAFKVEREPKITQATMGSIFDIGMRTIAEELGLESGERMQKTFGDYTLSGEIDLVDQKGRVFYDVKLTKVYAWEMWKKEPISHQYTIQQNLYRFLFDMEDWQMRLAWFLKDQSDMKKGHPKEALIVSEVPKVQKVTLTKMIEDSISQLQALQNGGEVTKCNDTWANDIRCKHYCDCKNVCPYAKRRGYNAGNAINW